MRKRLDSKMIKARALFSLMMLMALVGLAMAKVEVIVDAKDGEVISGEKVFTVRVKAESSVNSVEFYVNDELKDTDGSTPYEFRMDTVPMDEGPVKVKFSAYTENGESASTTLNLKIDNGVAKGFDFHLNNARQLVSERKFDAAILAGRVALKIKKGDNQARLVMARAWFGLGVMDTAQKFCEDVMISDPNNVEALELVAGIALQRAFNITASGGDNPDQALAAIQSALQRAVNARTKVLSDQLDKFGPVNDANRMRYVDTALRTGRYGLVIEQLAPIVRRDPKNTAATNRLVLAMMRGSRLRDLPSVMQNYIKYGEPDAAGFALRAIFLEITSAPRDEVDNAEREAVLNDSEDLGVRSAQAFLALRRGNTQVLRQVASNLAKDESQNPITNYYLTTVFFLTGNSEEARIRFERAALAEPAFYDLYVERANQALLRGQQPNTETRVRDYQRKVARVFFESALLAKADSFEALTGLAALDLLENKPADAVRRARAAASAGPEYAAAQYLLNAAITLEIGRLRNAVNKNAVDVGLLTDQVNAARRNNETTKLQDLSKQLDKLLEDGRAFSKALDQAEREARTALEASYRLDKINLDGRGTPTPEMAWGYFRQFGRTPLIMLGN